jgi:hypothetical protein
MWRFYIGKLPEWVFRGIVNSAMAICNAEFAQCWKYAFLLRAMRKHERSIHSVLFFFLLHLLVVVEGHSWCDGRESVSYRWMGRDDDTSGFHSWLKYCMLNEE